MQDPTSRCSVLTWQDIDVTDMDTKYGENMIRVSLLDDQSKHDEKEKRGGLGYFDSCVWCIFKGDVPRQIVTRDYGPIGSRAMNIT